MNVHETINYLFKYLESADSIYFLGDRKELFIQSLKHISNVINVLEKNKNLCELFPHENNLNLENQKIHGVLKYLLAVINEQPISIEFSDFAANFSILTFNYSNNMPNSKEIALLSDTINKYISLRFTTIELIQQLKIINKRLQELSHLSFQPIELSKHYLASLDLNK